MRAREKERLQRKLDREMQPFRRAGKDENPTNGLLRAVRKALRVPVAEIAGKMGVNRSGVFDLEARELRRLRNFAVDVADGGGDGVQVGLRDRAELWGDV